MEHVHSLLIKKYTVNEVVDKTACFVVSELIDNLNIYNILTFKINL